MPGAEDVHDIGALRQRQEGGTSPPRSGVPMATPPRGEAVHVDPAMGLEETVGRIGHARIEQVAGGQGHAVASVHERLA